MKKINIMNDDEIIRFRQDEMKRNNNTLVNKNTKEENNSKISILIKIIFFILIIIFLIDLSFNIIHNLFQRNNTKEIINYNNKVKNDINNDNDNDINIINDNKLFDNDNNEINRKIENCEEIDPINLFQKRINNGPINICIGKNTKHVCYANFNNYYNDIYAHKNGVICLMENIIIDPSKSEQSGLTYKGPVDNLHLGFPILYPGFFNTKCKTKDILENYNEIYNTYFSSWNYNYKINNEILEELSPGKTILFLSRNQDSPNLFHGNSEIINVISIMNLFDLIPEKIQIIFLESINIRQDPFYDIYKNMISRGGEPIYIRNLKKKYKISKAIHVPINWDSPAYLNVDYLSCNKSTKAYELYNNLVNRYLNIKTFHDPFKSKKDFFYYPKEIIDKHNSNINFTKIITIQWRRVWPKGRTGQFRILGNGRKLTDKLLSKIPNNKNFLIRLINTGKLSMRTQIALIRNTDYLVGIHGAGLTLAIFLPNKSILHEVLHADNLKVLAQMSALSGHKTYSDIIKAEVKHINGNEYIFFDEDEFANSVIQHMKENNFF